MNVQKKVTVKKTEKVVLKIDNKDIIDFLEEKGHDLPVLGTKIYIMVPSGGDYSGSDLDIDSDTPIIVEYKKESTTTE